MYIYIYFASDPTTVKLFRVFQSSYERTVMLCSSNIDFKGSATAFITRVLQATNTEHGGQRREIQDIGIVR